jgi:hypothetical protein
MQNCRSSRLPGLLPLRSFEVFLEGSQQKFDALKGILKSVCQAFAIAFLKEIFTFFKSIPPPSDSCYACFGYHIYAALPKETQGRVFAANFAYVNETPRHYNLSPISIPKRTKSQMTKRLKFLWLRV